jgi:hypothetical protein
MVVVPPDIMGEPTGFGFVLLNCFHSCLASMATWKCKENIAQLVPLMSSLGMLVGRVSIVTGTVVDIVNIQLFAGKREV